MTPPSAPSFTDQVTPAAEEPSITAVNCVVSPTNRAVWAGAIVTPKAPGLLLPPAPPPGFGAPPPGLGAPPSGFEAPPPGFGLPPPGLPAPAAPVLPPPLLGGALLLELPQPVVMIA